jgi:predicted site-specific integrase-resolvase
MPKKEIYKHRGEKMRGFVRQLTVETTQEEETEDLCQDILKILRSISSPTSY